MAETPWSDPTPAPRTPNINEAMLLELGRLTTRWGFLEGIVEDMLAGFLNTIPALLYPITSDIAIGTRLKHLRLVGRLRLNDDDFETLSALTTQASELCGYRNFIIHGLWVQTDDPDIAELSETRISRNSLVRAMLQYNNKEYLEWLVIEITSFSFSLYHFGRQLSAIGGEDPNGA
jgi:hypothetical protein